MPVSSQKKLTVKGKVLNNIEILNAGLEPEYKTRFWSLISNRIYNLFVTYVPRLIQLPFLPFIGYVTDLGNLAVKSAEIYVNGEPSVATNDDGLFNLQLLPGWYGCSHVHSR